MFEFRWALSNLKGSRIRYSAAMVLNLVLSVFVLVWPMLTKNIVTLITQAADSGVAVDAGKLLTVLGMWMALVLLRNGMSVTYTFLRESAAQNMTRNIRTRMFSTLTSQEGAFFDRINAGDIMTRLTGDLDVVCWNVRYIFFSLINTVVMFVAALIYFFTVSWQLTLCLLVVLPFIFITSRRFTKEMRPRYVANREKMATLNDIVQENIAANKTVRAFAREDYEYDKFEKANKDHLDTVLETNRVWLSIWPVPEFLSQLLTVIVLVVGGILVATGQSKPGAMTIADLSAFTSLIWALSNAMRNIGNLLNEFQRFFPSAGKVIEVYYSQPRILTPQDAVVTEGRLKGDIEFKDVGLKVGEAQIVSDISFKVKSGQTVAIVGETGSGKTTLINLLARFYDTTSGSVTVDGVDVRRRDLHQLRRSIGMATQDVFLFSDTIDGNIAFGDPDMSEENVHLNATRAAADEFINETEDGYDTIIGERGMGLSGGQRQRIALARALAVQPPILVLDDTTSAVDMKTETYIWDQLQSLPFPCTKIIIAQRITTVCAADMILVMQNGRITQSGTHEQLVAQEGFYKEIYTLQSQQTE